MIKDIYFNPHYGKIYEHIEQGTLETFVFRCPHGQIEHMFIKRPIPLAKDGFFDLVTPYGYGGPLITEAKDKDKLVSAFAEAFESYCRENHVVSEFVRFHPIFENALDFQSIYDTVYSRHTVGTNLKDFEDPVQAEFAKSLRRDLRRAEAAGVSCRAIQAPKDLSVFRRLYELTMDRNQAASYYYFDDDYYRNIIENLSEHVLELQLIYEDEIIASELYFIQGKYMHAHLLGSNDRMLDLNAGVMLEAAAARWGRENEYHYIHHGGGRTSADDDSLFLYKMKYGKHTRFDFYMGRKVWDREKYDTLVAERARQLDKSPDIDFFPRYRAE